MKRQVRTVASATSTIMNSSSRPPIISVTRNSVRSAMPRAGISGRAPPTRALARTIKPIVITTHNMTRASRCQPNRPRRYSSHSPLPSRAPSAAGTSTLGCQSQIVASRHVAKARSRQRGRGPAAGARRAALSGKKFGADDVGLLRALAPGVIEEPGEQHDGQGAQQLRWPGAGAAQGGERLVQIVVAGLQRPANQRQARNTAATNTATCSMKCSQRRPRGTAATQRPPARNSRTQRVPG